MLPRKCCVQNWMQQCLLLRQVSKASLHPWEPSSFNRTTAITYKFTISSFSLLLNLSARLKKSMVFIIKCVYWVSRRRQDVVFDLDFVTFLITKTCMSSGLGYKSIQNFMLLLYLYKGVLNDLYYSIITPTNTLINWINYRMHGAKIKNFIMFIFHYSERIIVYNNKYNTLIIL